MARKQLPQSSLHTVSRRYQRLKHKEEKRRKTEKRGRKKQEREKRKIKGKQGTGRTEPETRRERRKVNKAHSKVEKTECRSNYKQPTPNSHLLNIHLLLELLSCSWQLLMLQQLGDLCLDSCLFVL